MQYRTFTDLSNLIRNNIALIPHDIDLVVGIPRSGMIPAYMIALFLNKRVSDIDSFLKGKFVEAGERSQYIEQAPLRKILVVDDSVWSGSAMIKAKKKLKDANLKYEFLFLAPIVTTSGRDYVDIWLETIDDSRIFEWNVFHHGVLGCACIDIDGVLNLDPELDDDGPIYTNFLQTATPKFLPTAPLGTLVTCRLEKYRPQTEQWLKEHNIHYKHLIMLNFPDKASRVAWGKHGEYKAKCYIEDSSACLFIESSKEQAEIIARMSYKPVLCVETNQLLQYHPEPSNFKRLKRKLKKMFPKLYKIYRRYE